jgi:membrane protease YdiL (CAAX protease family)
MSERLQSHEARPLGDGEPAHPDDLPRWPASTGLIGLLLALLATLFIGAVIAIVFQAAGVEHPDDSSSFEFTAIAGQSLAFVAVALALTAGVAPPRARQFGFRPFRASALGWALLAFVVYLVLAAIYVELAQPPKDDLPQQLGADKSTALAVITGIFVIGVAPPVEEFFFRGFLYQSLRNRIGIRGAAPASALMWAGVHFKPEFLVPLAILGVALALLFEKTDSLWPCILVHALNNALAFSVTL